MEIKKWMVVLISFGILLNTPVFKQTVAAVTPEQYFEVENVSGGVSIINYTGTADGIYDVIIPQTIGGQTVIEIGQGAFSTLGITSVEFPNTIKAIRYGAFEFNSLENVQLPSNITTIGGAAFQFNDLTSITTPSSLTTIGSFAFQRNIITSYTFADGVQSIGEGAFYCNYPEEFDCGTTPIPESIMDIHLELPNSLTTIGEFAFADTALTSLKLSENLSWIQAETFDINYLKEVDVPESVENIDYKAFGSNQLTSIIIRNPDAVFDVGIFSGNETPPEEIIIYGYDPSTAKTYAEQNGHTFVNISEVEFNPEDYFTYTTESNQVTITGFTGDTINWTDVTIPDTLGGNPVVSIATIAFFQKGLTSVVLPNTVTSIETGAFSQNELISVTLPTSLTVLGTASFEGNKLTAIELPVGLIEIKNQALANNPLTEMNIPTNVTVIGMEAMYNTQLTVLEMPESVNQIGDRAFSNSLLEEIFFYNPNIILGTEILSGNQIVPENLTVYGYIPSTAKTYSDTNSHTFVDLDPPVGEFTLFKYPTKISFETYTIGLQNPLLNMTELFQVGIETTAGTIEGWEYRMNFSQFTNGTDSLRNPTMQLNADGIKAFNADESGNKTTAKTMGTDLVAQTNNIPFDTDIEIVEGSQVANEKYILEFQPEAIQLGFDNSSKKGVYRGTVSFSLVSSP